ncbi:MAG: gamma-glutamyltransferase [Rhodospirillales bacterium]|nr:gamma-glutamyltransferase [Rhodospirillales bacterium]
MKRILAALIVACCAIGPASAQDAGAQDRSQARSMVISQYGVAASEHPLASRIAVQILEQGGNAVDAAVAANAAMGLTAPMSNGIGGDLFAIIYEAKSGKLYGFNGSGWAPASLTPEFLKQHGIDKMPKRGIHSVTVPGTVDAWDQMLARFGSKTLAEVLAPSIAAAEEGIFPGEVVEGLWRGSVSTLREDPVAARTYLIGGDHAPRLGELFRNPDLAWSYRQLAQHGRDAFYKGEIAQRILKSSAAKGGTMVAADLADYRGEFAEPVSTLYRGWTVTELPPNGQGIAALEMLNILETFPIASYGHNSARALHAMIEAKKLAYADMLRYDADPRFAKIPTEGLISKQFAQQRATQIASDKANCDVRFAKPPGVGADTIYLSTVDRDGNMVSLIQSNYVSLGFGSGVVVDGGGFALQNRGGLFTLDDKDPNVLAGRKRPVHTIIPGFLAKGDTRIAFGIMGGWNQSQAHAQFVSNVVDFGMNIQAAMEAARFSKETFAGCDVQIEDRVPAEVRAELTRLGHDVKLRGAFSPAVMGGGQAVQRDFAAKVNYGASDPRKDGDAAAQMGSGAVATH